MADHATSSDIKSSDINFGLPGAAGRMGRMITKAVLEQQGVTITAATDRAGGEAIGADIAQLAGHPASGVMISDQADDLFAQDAHVIIDFTTPDTSVAHAKMAAERGVAIVVGTTGLGEEHIAALEEAAKKTAVVWCANTSVGVTMLGQLVEDAVRALGSDWDIEIIEAHHKHKVDAPSGTALALGEAAARGRGVKLADVADKVRDGITGEREDGAIGFAVMRGGDVVGEHSVIFYGQSERVEITHRAMDRMVLARGAVRAGVWAASAKPGLYSMKDVLA